MFKVDQPVECLIYGEGVVVEAEKLNEAGEVEDINRIIAIAYGVEEAE